MEKIEFKKATLQDIGHLQKIGRQTFYETFSLGNTEEDMMKYIDKNFSNEKLKKELSNNNSEFYVATLDNKVIGYLKVNFGESQTEIKAHNALEIERIYVIKEYHGKKVGQKLFNKAMEISKGKKVDYVWSGVWEKNPRAIRFYEKNNFVKFGEHTFTLGSDEQTDIMMKSEIK